MKKKERKYDLENRLLEFSAKIIKIVEELPQSRVGNHIAGQLIRAGTSPYANHGEAQSAESSRDFIHKMRICLKELRESMRWLRLIQRILLVKNQKILTEMVQETEELIKIFVVSIRTAHKESKKH